MALVEVCCDFDAFRMRPLKKQQRIAVSLIFYYLCRLHGPVFWVMR